MPAGTETPRTEAKQLHDMLLENTGIDMKNITRNAAAPLLYEHALTYEQGTVITSTGALVTSSGAKKGRSPADKRITYEETTCNDIWFGPVNFKLDEHVFMINRERAIDYLNTRERVYIFDGFAGTLISIFTWKISSLIIL
jgi:phosphoenolpyruvate carboxykinase (ATP)